MNTVVNTINAAGQAFVDFALPMLIQSGVLVLILLLIDLALRRRVRAVFRYWIWMLVLLKLILPPSLWSPFSFGTWFGQTLETPAAVLQETTPPMEPSPVPVWQPQAKLGDGVPSVPIAKDFALDAAPPVATPPARVPTPQPEYDAVKPTATPVPTQPAASLTWQALVLLAWAATVLALLLLLLQRACFVRSLVAQAQKAPPKLVAAMDACRARVGLAGPVALRISPNATSPAVCGLLRPVILIPNNLAPKLQQHDLDAVLLHELAHIKRGDLWVNLIQTLLQIAYFYNPLLWLANVMIRRIREQAVDEAVLVAMGETAGDYPETLLNVAKLAFRKRPTLSLRLIGVVESKSALTARIKHILTRPFPKTAKLGLLGVAVVFLIAAVLLPMAKARPLTDRARNVMTLAREEARQLNHSYVGTEHILLALAREKDAVSTQVFVNLGVDIETLRTEVNKFVQPGSQPATKRRLPRTPRAKRVMKYAREEARALSHDYIGTEHILLGLIREKEGVAAQVLAGLGIAETQIRAEIFTFVRSGAKDSGDGSDRIERQEESEIVLPDVDHEAVMLDLASGKLLALPQGESPGEIWQAIKKVGRGDLVYDTSSLILVRDATTDAGVRTVTESFKTYPIGRPLPEILIVTTAEGQQYTITILAADDKGCTLTSSPIPIDNGAGGGAPVAPSRREVSAQEPEPAPPSSVLSRQVESGTVLSELGKALAIYANDHDDAYPETLASLDVQRMKAEQKQWLLANVAYLGRGKTIHDTPDLVLAYDKTLLAEGGGTNVLHNSYRVAFKTPAELKALGIPPLQDRVELPNGVTVEFLAYSWLSPGGLIWYDPQGEETSVPGVYEADVEGLGTVLAFRVEPPEAHLVAQVYRGPDSQNVEKPWQLPESHLWLLPLGEERNFANLRITTSLTLPPVIETIALTDANLGQLVEINRCGIAKIVDLHVFDSTGSDMMMYEMTRKMGLPLDLGTDSEMAESMGLREMVEPPTLRFSCINAPDSSQSIVALLDKEGRTYPVERVKSGFTGGTYQATLWPNRLAGIVVETSAVHTADVRFRNISLSPAHVTEIQIEANPDRQISWKLSYASMLREILTNSTAQYCGEHGGRFPSKLEALERNHDEEAFRWLLTHIAYAGEGKNSKDDPRSVIAYDKTLLARGQGTYVFYSDGQFEFESPAELQELGLLPLGQAATYRGLRPGPLGRNALSFDGVDDCLIVPASPSLTLKPPFAIEIWIKPDFSDTPGKERPNMSLLVRKRKLAAPERGGYVALTGSSPELGTPCWANLYYAYGGGKLAQTGRFVADGPSLGHPGWFHLSLDVTRDDYVIAPDHPLVIGGRASPDGASFKGEIAEIRIWNRRLTDEETRYYADIPLTGHEPGLVACWDFERSPGDQIVYDISPNANHAHLGKTADTDDADPKWVGLTENTVSTPSMTSTKGVDHNDLQQGLFTVRGRVTDESGRPLTGVEMLARCGFENPPLAHRTLTDQNGQYTLRFSHTMKVPDADPYEVGIQKAPIEARMKGYHEVNLCRQGNLAVAGQAPGPERQRFVAGYAGVVLPGKPYELDFVMRPAARIEGQILDEAGTPVLRPHVWLHSDKPLGTTRPYGITQGNGWFTLESIPCGSCWFTSAQTYPASSETVTLARPGTYRATLQFGQFPSGQPSLRIVAFQTPAFDRSDPAFDQPRVVDPDGVPVAGAQVALCTKDQGVLVQDGRLDVNRMGGANSTIVETDAQGRFSFAEEPEAFHIVAAHEKGFAWVTNEEFAALPEVRLQRWGRIEGTLYIGRKRGEEKRMGLMNCINKNAIDQRVRYDYEAHTDPNGRFVFDKVPPGWVEVGYLIQVGGPSFRTFTYTARTPLQVLPGKTTLTPIGGRGRPVVGKFVPQAGYEGPVYFGGGLRALDTVRPERPTPENYEQMTTREQQEWLRQWRETPEAEAYYDALWHDPQRRHYSFRIQDDGTFRIEDVIPGQYTLMVWLEEPLGDQAPPEEIGAYHGTIEVSEMDEAYSDKPLDLGELVVRMHAQLQVGDVAPLFEEKSSDGDNIRLSDYRGRFVLLSFGYPLPVSELDQIKELHRKYEASGRLQIIGFKGFGTLASMKEYIRKYEIQWPEIFLSERMDSAIARQYGLAELPYSLLIDPEGRIVAPRLRGEKLTNTVREALENAPLGISGRVLDPNSPLISRKNLYSVARSASYKVGPEWFQVAESSADRVYQMVQIYAERYGEPGFNRVLDDWVRWKYNLDNMVETNSAMALFTQFCNQFDEERKFDAWSDPRIRAIGLISDKLNAKALMDRYVDALRSRRSFYSSVGYRDAPLSIEDPILTGHEGGCLPASISAVWYALRRADEKLDDRYPSRSNVIEQTLTPILIEQYKKRKMLDLLDRAVLLGGPKIAEFLLKQDWQGAHDERVREIVGHPVYVNKWLLRLINLDDPAGDTFRREHPELVLWFADLWAGHPRSNMDFTPPRFLLLDKERGKDSFAWRYWPRYSQKMDAIWYEGKRLAQKFSYLMMLEPYTTTQMYFDSWIQVIDEREDVVWHPRDIIMGSVPVLRRRPLATMMLGAIEERLEKIGMRNDQNRNAWDRLNSDRTMLTMLLSEMTASEEEIQNELGSPAKGNGVSTADGVLGRYVRLGDRGTSKDYNGQYTEVEMYGRLP